MPSPEATISVWNDDFRFGHMAGHLQGSTMSTTRICTCPLAPPRRS
jgi:hypothetical protein